MTTSPRYSIITVGYSRNQISNLWKSFKKQKFPTSWEWIIIVESDADLTHLTKRLQPALNVSPNIMLFSMKDPSPENTKAERILYAVTKSSGNFLVIFNSDIAFNQGAFEYLENIAGDVDNRNDLTVIGPYETEPPIYAPDHFWPDLHIWKRNSFLNLQGYNKTLTIGLHYEVLCRAYIAGYKISYHNWGPIKSFITKKSDELIATHRAIAHQMFSELIRQEANRKKLKIGTIVIPEHSDKKFEDDVLLITYSNGILTCEGDYLADGSFGIIQAADFLNYLSRDEILPFWEKVWNLLAPHGWFVSATPDGAGMGAFADPRNRSYWNKFSFSLFCLTKDSPFNLGLSGPFEHNRVYTDFPSPWHRENDFSYVHADLRKLP